MDNPPPNTPKVNQNNLGRPDLSSLTKENPTESNAIQIPEISLPKGGGALKGIDEKFTVNAVNGTNSMSIPLPVGAGRGGFSPSLSLSYSSGFGNGPYGLGWSVGIPFIKRKTEQELPQYKDEIDSDTFILSGAEDLVPLLKQNTTTGEWEKDIRETTEFIIKKYRPRIEGLWAKIEQWKSKQTGVIHWRTISSSNVTTLYGFDENSRLANPDPKHKNDQGNSIQIYEWLISHSFDDKGNLVIYKYKHEDFVNIPSTIFEKNRSLNNCTNLYLKKVCYGNRSPYFRGDILPNETDFLFETVFDYGEHDLNNPKPNDNGSWDIRTDVFSSFRSGFDIRTYRLCKRVLLFHKFDELPINPYLVSSLEVGYENFPGKEIDEYVIEGFNYLKQATQRGYLFDSSTNQYKSKTFPTLQFFYQPHEWKIEVEEISTENIYNAPAGIDFQSYQWIDLYSEGVSGILSEKNNAWYYKQNMGNGEFTPATLIAPKPSFAGISNGSLQLQDLEGVGDTYLVNWANEPKGFFRLTDDEKWQPFKAFKKTPSENLLANPNARFIDLNGDGLPEILISENDVFLWYESVGEDGFDAAKKIGKALDEESGPRIVFADLEQSIFLADMSGDGLTDIARIRNSEVCYWANLGYGRFSSKITMADAPILDIPENYNPNFIRLADIDGSGTTDIVYLGKNDFRVWMNLSGNAWSKETYTIADFPAIDSLADISVLDLLGTGTSCIVWSSPLPNDSNAPLRYINLMNSKKPHILNRYENNMGKEVTFEYLPSTHFYLEDKKLGKSWATKLPFPVHVVSKVRSEDKIRETVFTNTYSYHHGYFDGKEREFRGFGRVEQLDTEDFSSFSLNTAQNVVEEPLHQPPVKTVTWFHTGAFFSKQLLTEAYQSEYYQNDHLQEHQLPPSDIPANLNTQEWCEALRAFKSMVLRQEVYAEDGREKSIHPYSTAQTAYDIVLVQPQGENKYASFLITPKASLSYNYDRNPADPRIAHSMVLETDNKGFVTKSASIIYPRVSRPLPPDNIPDVVWNEQNKRHIVYSEMDLTNDIETDDNNRIRSSYEGRSYELLEVPVPEHQFLTREDLLLYSQNATPISFENKGDGSLQKRLSSHSRIYFLRNDLNGGLPLGQWDSLGLGFKSYQLAFTPGLIDQLYNGKVTNSMLTQAGYEQIEGDNNWWIPSGTTIYAADAANHFYLPIGTQDALGKQSLVFYDRYDLLLESTMDAIGNTVSVQNDYRTLSPHSIIDPNKNRSVVETDELKMVIKSVVMGKEGANEGDTLQDPTARIEYDLFNWVNNQKPNYAHTFTREQHGVANLRWQETYVYSDGSGSVIMTKVQAEPGVAKRWNEATNQIEEINTNNRWVGNGRTILNNKGNPIKQYEPYFSATYEYENEAVLVETGVTPIIYYDAIGRNVKTDLPNGTFTKVEFAPWYSKNYDTNDTVKESQWYIERGSPNPDTNPEPTDPEERAAWLASKHYETPSTILTDSLGRVIYTIADHGNGKTTVVRSESDLMGRYSKIFDQLDREVATENNNLVGASIYGKSSERGERWIFQDVLGRMVRIWDNDIREFRTTYDDLHRPVSAFVEERGNEILFNHIVYGENHPNAEDLNLKGQTYQVYDQAGGMTINGFDFKGNPIEVERRLTVDYKNTINWQPLEGLIDLASISTIANTLLENERFTSSTLVDALNRPTQVTLPDGTIIIPQYNEANYLNSLQAQIKGRGQFITFLEDQNYDAKGQREYAKFGNGTITKYFYDPKTFRLTNLLTQRQEAEPVTNSLQNIKYSYDPIGNITQIIDDAQQTHYFRNSVVRPERLFEYDAIYRLIKATGREHAGIGGNAQRNHNDIPFITQLPHSNDTSAVRTYRENYFYDDLGNIDRIQHITPNGIGNWTRRYQYAFHNDPTNNTNRLTATSLPGDAEGSFTATYSYDLHGNMTQMPHLQDMGWNFLDQLREVNLGGGGSAYYVYGGSGQRMRKVVERTGGLRQERIYLGTVEIYREFSGNNLLLERETVHISDDSGRIAQTDTKTIDANNSDSANPLNVSLIRYQYSNHLGSAVLETDSDGVVISYEEFHPFGTTAYHSSKSDVDLSLKRYRFTGKERDSETGLDYFGARYYASWLGRWTSSDPLGYVDGINLYQYTLNNPIFYRDLNGTQSQGSQNPRGDVTWRSSSTTFSNLSDAQAIQRFQQQARNNPDIPDFTPGSVTVRWVTRNGQRTPIFNAEWLDSNGQPLLPRRGEHGSVEPMQRQPRAEYSQPGNRASRTTENEHTTQRGVTGQILGDDEDSNPRYTNRDYRRDATVRSPRSVSLDKTQQDNIHTRELRQRIANGERVNYNEEMMRSNRNFHRANDNAGQPIRPGSINRGTLEQAGNMFGGTRLSDVSDQLPRQSRWQRFTEGVANVGRRITYNSRGYNRFGAFARGAGGVAAGLGTAAAYQAVPFLAETAVAVESAGYLAYSTGAASLPVVGEVAAAAIAAPGAVAATVVGSAVGGYIVGDVVEDVVTEATGSRAVGVGAGTLAGAGTGAAIGAAVGSIVPGLGTAVGAGVGAVVGGVAGFIGSFW